MGVPYNYQEINNVYGHYRPSTQQSYNNETFVFWERALYQRASYAIKLTLPEAWMDDRLGLFYYVLFHDGYLGIFETEKYGLVFQPGTLSGFDLYYRPVRFIVANPLLSGEFRIGGVDVDKSVENVDNVCEIVKLAPDYLGVWDIIDFYARKLANLSLSVDISIINTRFAKIFTARNKAAAETLKKVQDKVNSGEPVVIVDQTLTNDRTDKDLPLQTYEIEHLKENYITDKQLQDIQTVLNMFDNEIGIPTVPYQKRERMVVDEAQSKQIEASARITIWIDTLNSCFKTVNARYGTNFKAERREVPKLTEGGVSNGEIFSP